jgi:hypothetical protein
MVMAVLVGTPGMTSRAEAHDPRLSLSGLGTPAVDGVLDTGEWDAAGRFDFTVSRPPEEGGGTTAATLYVMNDATNLYLAVKVFGSSLPSGNSVLVFEFDNDHDGVWPESGEDILALRIAPQARIVDQFYTQQPPCPANLWCT